MDEKRLRAIIFEGSTSEKAKVSKMDLIEYSRKIINHYESSENIKDLKKQLESAKETEVGLQETLNTVLLEVSDKNRYREESEVLMRLNSKLRKSLKNLIIVNISIIILIILISLIV